MGAKLKDAGHQARVVITNRKAVEGFGDALAKAMLDADLTKMDLHRASGVSYDGILRILKGANGLSLETAARLATAAGVPLHQLLQP